MGPGRDSPAPHSRIIQSTSMSAFLDEILGSTRAKVALAKRTADLRDLERRAEQHVPRGFRKLLLEKSRISTAVIAELKKASPSKGLIRPQFPVEQLAKELEEAGAAALSVLTDEEFFQGSLENLRAASTATRLPCLRKDFIIDEHQLLEARANSADAVLLIVAALSNTELNRLGLAAHLHDLDVLCEAHDENELQRALDAGFNLIGVNTRDLRTFKVDPETAFRLAARIPKSVVAVAESGIRSGNEIAELRAAGYQAFLIGETLMRAESPGKVLRELLAQAQIPTA